MADIIQIGSVSIYQDIELPVIIPPLGIHQDQEPG